MIRTYEISATRPAPVQPGQMLRAAPTPLLDPEGQAFVTAWLG